MTIILPLKKLFQSNISESLKFGLPATDIFKLKKEETINIIPKLKKQQKILKENKSETIQNLKKMLEIQNINKSLLPFISKILKTNPEINELIKTNPELLKIIDPDISKVDKINLLNKFNINTTEFDKFIEKKIEIISPDFKLTNII